MQTILITGAGKIGALIAAMLANTGDYNLLITDVSFAGNDIKRVLENHPDHIEAVELDISDKRQVDIFFNSHNFDAVISSLPYYLNEHVAQLAKTHNMHYFDLTEDVQVTSLVKALAEGAKQAFVPQCGLAPGFISIVANSLMQDFSEVDVVKMRVGALPQHTSNALHYALTWSTEGLINEYGNTCYGIHNKNLVPLQPLGDLEKIQLDGLDYEAFNTSGGLGGLAEQNVGKVNTMNYKTIRYPGHCEKMRVLMHDLKLNTDRQTLRAILERAIPKTYQDVVLVYVSVSGIQNGSFVEKNYVKKIYPREISGFTWSAIQVTTAAGICGVVDIVLAQPKKYQGFIQPDNIPLDTFLANRFGQYYQ